MTPTPTQIAHEADVLAHRICRTAGIPLTDTEMVRSISSLASEHLSALILSAAAKMVQQSGAVEAIEKALGDCEAGQWSSVKDRFTTSTLNDVNAALQSLRSITGEAKQGDS